MNFEFLNKHRLRGPQYGLYSSTPEDGFNGAFQFPIPGEPRTVCVIASDQLGWRHVSVSFGAHSSKTPSWDVMCAVKDLFWDPEDAVIQIHPPKSDYVNNHLGCLHLWQPTSEKIPLPPSIMVGFK